MGILSKDFGYTISSTLYPFNMLPSKLSFSTVDDLTNDIPEYRPRGGTTNTYKLPVF